MANNSVEGILLTAKFYNNSNNTDILAPEKGKLEKKSAVNPEGMVVKQQEKTTTKQQTIWKTCVNKIHTKLVHPREDRMRVSTNNLHYRVKGAMEVFEDLTTAKSKNKFLRKVVEERDLNPGKMIYLDISSQKKPSYGGSNNFILIQDSDTKKNVFFAKTKE